MSFLERFKLHSRWKSADPETRVAGVNDLTSSPEDLVILAALAREDSDVRVRRAAVAAIDDINVLVAVADRDPDDALRTEVRDRLVALASSPEHPDVAMAALAGLAEAKHLANIARSSPHEAVRTEAVARITDAKALSAVARQAPDAKIAHLATDRLTDPAELIAVALKTEHKDAGIAALERAAAAGTVDRETLEGVAARAKQKAVGKRARAMVQALDEKEAARRVAIEQRQQRLASVLARVEALAAAPETVDADVELAAATVEWRELAADSAFELGDDDNQRFMAAAASAHEALDRLAERRAAERDRAERVNSIRGARASLCERVEILAGETLLDDLAAARGEWEGLPVVDEPDAEDHGLLARFAGACDRAAERHANREQIAHAESRLSDVAREAAEAAAREDTPAYLWESIAREWRDLTASGAAPSPEAVQQFTEAETAVRDRAEAKRAAAERTLRQHVQRFEQLVERAQKRAAAEDLTLREADKAARDLRAAIEAPPAVNPAERDALIDRLKAALGTLAPRLHELREMDEWKRFANAAIQEEMIAQTEALRTRYDLEKPEDVEKAAAELHAIQERWKLAAEAPRAQAQTLWHRYRLAADPIQVRARAFFAQRAEERQGNLARKLALVERAEALADSTDWIQTADELKKLQAEWQQIGPVGRAETRVVWKRFRDACDQFFTRRNADLAERKEVWAANQGKKEALCVRADELAESKDWERAAGEIRRLQAEWKTVGPVRRTKSEALWQRFRAACDRFFDRYKRRDEIELESRQADREGLAQELEALAPPEGDAPAEAPPDLLERVRSLRSRWNQSMPGVRQGADPLSGRFVAALEHVVTRYPSPFQGTELDGDASRERMEKLCARVEGLLTDAGEKPVGSSQALADMLREALAANTIGGRASDDAKWRSMADEVRQTQASWSRLGPVPGEAGRQLQDRFHKACNRFFDQYRRRVPPETAARGRRPVGSRT